MGGGDAEDVEQPDRVGGEVVQRVRQLDRLTPPDGGEPVPEPAPVLKPD